MSFSKFCFNSLLATCCISLSAHSFAETPNEKEPKQAQQQERMQLFEVDPRYRAQLERLLNEGVSSRARAPQDRFSSADRELLLQQQEILREQLESLPNNRWFDGINIDPREQMDNLYYGSANELVQQTQSRLPAAIQSVSGISASEAGMFTADNSHSEQAEDGSFKALYISFSMTDDALRAALEEARDAGAQVFLNGLKPGHRGIQETMVAIQEVATGIENPPFTRFHPEAFDRFGITQVPTMMIHQNGKSVLASGITNFKWLEERLEDESSGVTHLGAYGPTAEVQERNLLEEIQERLAEIDWEEKQRQAVANFWNNQEFFELPKATADEEWYIDPTIRVVEDIVNPRGDVLAHAGQVVNPLHQATANLAIYIFDGQDIEQVEWLIHELSTAETPAQTMLITSRLDRQNGWEHLEVIRGMFRQEVYLLPEEIISKFQITALPALVQTDLEKGMMRINQFQL